MHTLKRIFLPVIIVIMLAVLTMPVLGNQATDNTAWSSTRPLSANLPLQIPILIAPANNFTTTNADIVFSWQSVSGATEYQLQIAYLTSFSSSYIVLDQTFSTNSPTHKFYHTGTMYWRVRGKNGSTYSQWSSVRQFTLQPMNAPELLAPTNALTVSDPNITFSWGAVQYAQQYEVQIAYANTFFNADMIDNVLVTSPNYNYVFSALGTYYWRIRARNGVIGGTWSPSYQVTVQSDAVPTLLSPHSHIISYTPTFILTWTAVSGATDYELQIARDYHFTTIIEQRTTANTTATYTFSLYDRYYWRIRVVGELWSEARAITFAFIPFSGGTTTRLDVGYNFYRFSLRDNGQSIFTDHSHEYDFLTQTTNDLLIEENVSGLGATTDLVIRDISSDGRYALIEMTFEGVYGAYRYDRVMGTVALVSKDSNGIPMPLPYAIDISDDGNLSLFIIQEFINDVPGPRNYFLHNSQTGETTLVSTSATPTLTPRMGYISENNRYVAMIYSPPNVIDYIPAYLYLYDVQTQVSQPVMTPNNTPVLTSYWQLEGNLNVVFYDNDRYVAFTSPDNALIPNATNTGMFSYDIQTGLLESIPILVNDAYSTGLFYDISPDGRYVVFSTYVFGTINDFQLFVYDRQQGTTTHVSRNSNGVPGSVNFTMSARISPDGNYVAFHGAMDYYGIWQGGVFIYTLPSNISSVAFGEGAFSPARLSAVGSGSLTTEFRWTPIRGILDYQIQIASDIEFNNILYDVDVNATSHTQTFPQTGTYYWRVRGENSWGDGLWSDTFHIIIGEGATVVIDEQQLFNMAQPLLTHDITSVLFDITPTGIFTTTQFGNGAVVTAIIRLPLINGLIRVNTESVVGGNATQQSAIYEVMPALLLTILDERLPDNYLVVESIGLTGSTITMNIVLPSNP